MRSKSLQNQQNKTSTKNKMWWCTHIQWTTTGCPYRSRRLNPKYNKRSGIERNHPGHVRNQRRSTTTKNNGIRTGVNKKL